MVKKKDVVSKKDVKEKVKKDPRQEMIDKRNQLINEIKPKLLTQTKLRFGGSEARRIHTHEMNAYTGVLNEINDLGKQLGLSKIGLGNLRRE